MLPATWLKSSTTGLRAERGPLQTRLRSWGVAYAPAVALAVLLPKCPLCIAAQLALIGVVVPLPSYARWIAIALSVAIGTAVVLVRDKSRARTTRHTVDCYRPRSNGSRIVRASE